MASSHAVPGANPAATCSMCGPRFCSMRISQDIRDGAKAGMAQKAAEFPGGGRGDLRAARYKFLMGRGPAGATSIWHPQFISAASQDLVNETRRAGHRPRQRISAPVRAPRSFGPRWRRLAHNHDPGRGGSSGGCVFCRGIRLVALSHGFQSDPDVGAGPSPGAPSPRRSR